MGIPERLRAKVNGHELLGGEEAIVGAIAIPPGATLYGGYSRGDGGYGVHAQVSGPLLDAVASKTAASESGLAGRMPRQQGALVLTGQRLLFLKLTKLTSKPKQLLAEWAHSEITEAAAGDGQSYPYIDLQFSDDSRVRVYSEKAGGTQEIAAALSRELG